MLILLDKLRQMLRDRQAVLRDMTPSMWGAYALAVAHRCIGMQEQGGNNAGPDVEQLRRWQGPRGAWCAAAVSYWIEEGWARLIGEPTWDELSDGERRECPVQRSHGARRLWRRAAKCGRIVKTPMPGDLALWARGREKWQGHIGIVSRVEGERWWYIAGNEGPFPAKVQEHEGTEKRRLIGFARLG